MHLSNSRVFMCIPHSQIFRMRHRPAPLCDGIAPADPAYLPVLPAGKYVPTMGLRIPERGSEGRVFSDLEKLTLQHKIALGISHLRSRNDPVVSVESCRTAVPYLKQNEIGLLGLEGRLPASVSWCQCLCFIDRRPCVLERPSASRMSR